MIVGPVKTTTIVMTLTTFRLLIKEDADVPSVGPVSADTSDVIQVMIQLEQDKHRVKTSNKIVLETDKDMDSDEKEEEELKKVL